MSSSDLFKDYCTDPGIWDEMWTAEYVRAQYAQVLEHFNTVSNEELIKTEELAKRFSRVRG